MQGIDTDRESTFEEAMCMEGSLSRRLCVQYSSLGREQIPRVRCGGEPSARRDGHLLSGELCAVQVIRLQ